MPTSGQSAQAREPADTPVRAETGAPAWARTGDALAAGEQLSLQEMSRIMDVAATLRKERALVDAQLNIQQIKAALRERLLEAAKISGDPVTAAEIDAAVEQYYSQLHEFRDPPASFAKFVAHVWVLRATLIKAAIAAVAATGMLWSVLALMLLLALFPREVKPPIVSRPGQPTSRYSMHQPGMPVAAGLAPSPGRGGPFIVC